MVDVDNVTRLSRPVERKLEAELRASLELLEQLRTRHYEETPEQALRAAEFCKGYELGIAKSRRKYLEAARLCGLDIETASKIQRTFLELCAKDDPAPIPPPAA